MNFCQIPRNRLWPVLLTVKIILFLQGSIFGNVMIDSNNTDRSMQAFLVTSEPTLDGDVINDPFWQNISPSTDFTQTRPYPGRPASERTEVRIAYDRKNLYLSFVCFDQFPERLVVSDARRDASLDNTDAVLMILDTYNDGQNGFVFGTNAIGVEYDAQVDNEGEGNFNLNRQQGGVIGGFNLNWDGSWEVKTSVGADHWSAEFLIPLRTIRFRSGENQKWGINFRRNIRRTNEISYWSPIPVNFDLNRLSLAGTLTGLNLSNPGNLKVVPYGLTRFVRDYEREGKKIKSDWEVGGDIKYSITPSLTLDLTANTDFAQVEVDEEQVNLDRFNLFFPEKRPFFLENAGVFSVGSPGEVDLFFSRRIGIDAQGGVVPIIGGARLSGKVNKTNLGFMSMFTNETIGGDEHQNYSVGRVNHEFGQRSAIGGLFVNRTGLGDDQNNFNRTFALDGKIGIGQKARVFGFAGLTSTPGVDRQEHALKVQGEYDWNGWEMHAAYTEVGSGFNPEVGFLLREAFRKPEFRVLYHWRFDGKWGFLELRPHVSYRSYWNFQGFQETKFLHIDNHWEWTNGLEIHTGINLTTEGVVTPFEIFDGITVPAGTYHHKEAQLVFSTNQSKTLAISTRHILGGFFGGRRYSNSATLYFRLGDRFNSEFSLRRNDIDLDEGRFNTNVVGIRLSYAFSPKMFIQSFIQYNSVVDSWSANVRFSLLKQANSGLFVVYNEAYGYDRILHRSLTLKYSYLLDVIR